ncbi:MAG: PhoH family protein [Candidatus Latescibacterota bacterium]|nr:MAG: PhoH family protein [Candidatus Latescibacterota bacterium]
MKAKRRVLSFAGIDPLRLFGQREGHLEILEEKYPGVVVVRGDEIILKGSDDDLKCLTDFFGELFEIVKKGRVITEQDFRRLLRVDGSNRGVSLDDLDKEVVVVTKGGRAIRPKTFNQNRYHEAIAKYDIVFAIGPAGTGKTYLAVANAVAALKRKEIDRIFLVRPVVEAGESLGFLPGDFQAKLDPYMRPVLDALYDMLGPERTTKYQENGTIEIAPLAYMRGRTLNNAYVILDEAQNTTKMQMKMFLTRLGSNAKAIINGDITQIDLDPPSRSGLVEAQKILSDVDGLEFIHLTAEDVVRHRLVQKIIDAFARNGNNTENAET